MSGTVKDQSEFTIRLDEIEEAGYRLACSKSKAWISEIVSDVKDISFSFIDDLIIQVECSKSGKSIMVSGMIATAVTLRCVRCLDEFSLPLRAIFHYTLSPLHKKELLPEMEISKEDLDGAYYQGDSVDITPLIREQILLSIPLYPHCQESCKGICPRCGANLNQGVCHCHEKVVTTSKFEKLKKFPFKH